MQGLNTLIVNNIPLSLRAPEGEAFAVAKKAISRVCRVPSDAECRIFRKSVDGRRRNEIKFIVSVAVSGEFSASEEAFTKAGITVLHQQDPKIEFGETALSSRPVIVGSGPCGLFAALLLAENGYAPIVLERGGSVEERKKTVSQFRSSRILDPETNIQFGAGGAGTFSDGKLITRIADPMTSYVLKRFVSFGAPEEILTLAKPHIGTDILCGVVENMGKWICKLGGEILYHTKFTGVRSSGNKVTAVQTNIGEIPAGALVLAVGHSARDTYENLMKAGFVLQPKPFSVGMRIEHLTEDIDRAMYGKFAGDPALGHAEYALSTNTKVRGVYTFCMCPGGEVVAAASETGGLVVNGMSEHARAGKNSNSAVVCSVFKEDYGNTPEGAIAYQRQIERAAFAAGGGDYSVPLITVGDFLDEKQGTKPTAVKPTYMGGEAYRLSSPDLFLPKTVVSGIRDALPDFDRKIHGFASPTAILSGAETRTSAPIRMVRTTDLRTYDNFENLYPAGEGAGYAGGITSAAVDGIHTALALMKKYRPTMG